MDIAKVKGHVKVQLLMVVMIATGNNCDITWPVTWLVIISDELSGTESEGGESGEEGKRKLLLRIKRERIHNNKDPIAKILKVYILK